MSLRLTHNTHASPLLRAPPPPPPPPPPRLPQGFVFVNFDRDMRIMGVDGDGKPKWEWARCRNSNLNEDLGKVGATPRLAAAATGTWGHCIRGATAGW